MYCKNCGKELKGTERFCSSCGVQVTVSKDVSVVQNQENGENIENIQENFIEHKGQVMSLNGCRKCGKIIKDIKKEYCPYCGANLKGDELDEIITSEQEFRKMCEARVDDIKKERIIFVVILLVCILLGFFSVTFRV